MKNESAFPSAPMQNHGETLNVGGLTKRELFAAMMMQGILSKPFLFVTTKESSEIDLENPREKIANDAVRNADALILELNKVET